jgi:hypothetical protein
MQEAEARAALTSFLSSQGHGCTDEAILDLRGALASYSVHMDAAQRTWPHPQRYRLAPRVNGEKVELRALDDTDGLDVNPLWGLGFLLFVCALCAIPA